MEIKELREIIKDNIDDIYNNIHAILISSFGDKEYLIVRKEYCGVIVKLGMDSYLYDDDMGYIVNMFQFKMVIIKTNYNCVAIHITTHYLKDGDCIKYSKEEILLQIENKIGD